MQYLRMHEAAQPLTLAVSRYGPVVGVTPSANADSAWDVDTYQGCM